MKYKLININTKEEHLCDKVIIDGFDYYVSDEKPKNGDFAIYKSGELIHYVVQLNTDNLSKVIATNNPNIDIPKVVDEVEELANQKALPHLRAVFIEGYNKSQETHPFSLDDVKEIINLAREQYWDVDNRGFSSNTEGDWSFKYSTEDEIIQKYQETKIVYYV